LDDFTMHNISQILRKLNAGLESDTHGHLTCEDETLDGAVEALSDTVSDTDFLVSVSSNGLANQPARAQGLWLLGESPVLPTRTGPFSEVSP
jgi:hypothetical protein